MQKLHRVKCAPGPFWLEAIPAGVAVLAILAARLTSASTLCWDVAWTAGAASALIGALAARRGATGSGRGRWTLWAAASGCWMFGQLA